MSDVRIRLDFGYDGTFFRGWAKQPGLRTVQAELEAALCMLLRQDAISGMTVAGRTDAGVHARHQVCHFELDSDQLLRLGGRQSAAGTGAGAGACTGAVAESLGVDPLTLAARRINGALRKNNATDIVVHRATVVADNFDARFTAVSRRYEYRILQAGARQDVLARGYTVAMSRHVNVALLNEASQGLVGLRDFATFCKPREGATTVRDLQDFCWSEDDQGVIVARLVADAFCHSMVRALVGGVLAVATGQLTLAQLQEFTVNKQRTGKIKVMPAHGLSLEEVCYPDASGYDARAEVTRNKRG